VNSFATDGERKSESIQEPILSPVANRREAPIGGCVYKKLLDMFCPFANISLERNLNAVEKRYFEYNMSYFTRKEKR
jgi:hypothetical protein